MEQAIIDILPFGSDKYIWSKVWHLREEWGDINDHLNMAFYHVLFDKSLDQLLSPLGLSDTYRLANKVTTFTAEVHTRYEREVLLSDEVRVRMRLLDFDPKKMRFFSELFNIAKGQRVACSEELLVFVDSADRKVIPMPEHLLERFSWLKLHQQDLEIDSIVGKGIRMKKQHV